MTTQNRNDRTIRNIRMFNKSDNQIRFLLKDAVRDLDLISEAIDDSRLDVKMKLTTKTRCDSCGYDHEEKSIVRDGKFSTCPECGVAVFVRPYVKVYFENTTDKDEFLRLNSLG